VGPEYIAIGLTAVVSAITGGSWVAGKILGRQNDQIQQAFNYIGSQKRRIDVLEDDLKRMPLEYVLKVDFLREIQQMHDNFNQINNKLDKLMGEIARIKMSYILEVQEDENGDQYITFPDEVVEELGWQEGDVLNWDVRGTGIIITKVNDAAGYEVIEE
jgi:hypothetical protein